MTLIDLASAPHHLPQLAAWHHAEWAHLNPGRSREELAAQMQEYLAATPLPRMFIAEADGRLLGSAALVAGDMDSHPELGPWLANVYVDAAQRGQGLGRLLVRAVMDHARALGLPRIYLFTPDQAAFYAALGWTPVLTEAFHGETVTVMRHDFAPLPETSAE